MGFVLVNRISYLCTAGRTLYIRLYQACLLSNFCWWICWWTTVVWSGLQLSTTEDLVFSSQFLALLPGNKGWNEMLLNRNLITLVPSATVERRTYCLTARSQTSVETTTDSCSAASRYKVSHDRWFCHHWPAIHFIVLMVQSKFAGARLVQNEAELGVCL